MDDGRLKTAGGRVFGITGFGETLERQGIWLMLI